MKGLTIFYQTLCSAFICYIYALFYLLVLHHVTNHLLHKQVINFLGVLPLVNGKEIKLPGHIYGLVNIVPNVRDPDIYGLVNIVPSVRDQLKRNNL